MTKRILSLLLVGILLLSLVPAQALATGGEADTAPSEEVTEPTVETTEPINLLLADSANGSDNEPDPIEETDPILWTVTFKQDDGSILKTEKFENGSFVPPYAPPEDSNFVFIGWYTERDSKWNFDADIVDKNITLTARWAIKVIFDTMGGTPDSFVQGANSDGTITQPEPPEKSGYKFAGWYNGNKLWDFDNGTVNTTTTLTAKWIPQVTFVTGENGSKVNPYNIETIPSTVEEPKKPTHSKDLDFGGWYKDNQFNEEDKWDFTKFTVSEPTTLYAKWTATVSFNTGTNDCKIDSQTVIENQTVTKLDVPSRGKDDEYQFVGWYNKDSKWESDSKVTENITLTAKWEAKVTFDSKIDNSTPTTHYVVIGDKISNSIVPSDFSNSGYVFDGWYETEQYKESDKWDFEKHTVSKPTTLYAKWLKKVKVSFNAGDGATYTGPAYVELGEGQAIDTNIPTPSKNNFVFDGWYGPNEVKWSFDTTSPDTVGNKDITLTAKWLTKLTVTFDPGDGATFTGIKQVGIGEGQTVAKPSKDPTKKYYIFDGWYYTNEQGEKVLWDFNSEITQNITLEAEWLEAVTVTFDSNSNNDSKQVIAINTTATEPNPAPTKSNYVFGGWYYTNEQGEKVLWDFNSEITQNITLEAKWNLKVIFNCKGGTPATIEQGVEKGGKIVKPDDPTKTGYVFGGWRTKDTTTSPLWDFEKGTVDETNFTLYAKWDVKVTFISNGGSAITPDTVILDQGDLIEKPENPVRPNYKFVEWCTDSGLTEPWDFSKKVDSNVKLYAKWEKTPLVISPTTKELYPGETVAFTAKYNDEDITSKVAWDVDSSDSKFDGATLTIGNNEEAGTIKVTVKYGNASDFALITVKPVYKFTYGTGSKWAQKSTKNLTFECNGPMDEIDTIKIGSTAVKEENYTLTESAHGFRLVLKSAAMSSLSVAKHTLTITFDDGGKAETTFEVIKESDIPETGDLQNLPLWCTLLGVSAAAAVLIQKKRRA